MIQQVLLELNAPAWPAPPSGAGQAGATGGLGAVGPHPVPVDATVKNHRINNAVYNLLAKLVVHSGRMRGWALEKNDGACLRAVLPQLLRDHRDARRIHLIWDNGSSHIAQETRDFLGSNYPQVRLLFTPAHASWLNQAELLLRAFAEHYLKRGDWTSRAELIDHLNASWPEYNRLFAHPFTWSWTRAKMHSWVDRHLS